MVILTLRHVKFSPTMTVLIYIPMLTAGLKAECVPMLVRRGYALTVLPQKERAAVMKPTTAAIWISRRLQTSLAEKLSADQARLLMVTGIQTGTCWI